ncbi:MAG: hypothetical protein CFE62_002370 [Candidatus Aquirickettsiella gammari]|uniref:Uncharacterized protein n=1 Tax=Candidatus Aquirickettsiella gammari TaxID=2016198 RepID=A0A370CIW3_9COXI|nr:MAG: hypothetical protein CFE62_002370 [Candidatus Aquirickettsiella gammari]
MIFSSGKRIDSDFSDVVLITLGGLQYLSNHVSNACEKIPQNTTLNVAANCLDTMRDGIEAAVRESKQILHCG